MVTITDSEVPVVSSKLDSLEVKYAIKFPQEYRDFLLKYNGGRPNPSKFHYLEVSGPYTDSRVDRFLAIYDGEYDNFEWMYTTLKIKQVRMPSNLVPIASDPFGNQICISVSGNDTGAVYFWDHEKEQDPRLGLPPTSDNVFLVARSFNDFLSILA